MKTNYLKIIFAILLLTGSILADGKYITIQLKNYNIITGELISARDDGLIICPDEGLSEEELADSLNLLIAVNYDQISQITIKEDSKLATSILLGTGIGLGSGILIGSIAFPGAHSSSGEAVRSWLRLLTAALFTTVGLIVGAVSGIFSSNGEENITILSKEKIELLKSYARYNKGEPEFLNQIHIE